MKAKLFTKGSGVLLCDVELRIQGVVTGNGNPYIAIFAKSIADVPMDAVARGEYLIFETEDGVRYLASADKATTDGGDAALTGTIMGEE